MTDTLTICLVHGSPLLASLWERQGHRVLHLLPEGPFFDIAAELEAQGVVPDLLVQVELLRERVLLKGLDKLACRKAFWAIDVHLNLFWHGFYGRLFDLVLSSQKGWLADLAREGVEGAAWLPWYGPAVDWTPHAERGRDISFVGRVTPQRPSRQWFAGFLEREFGVLPVESRDFSHMLELYRDTRLAPNESICGEINFRLFETAGCGCLALTQPGEGLDELFDIGREILVYHDAVQLKTLLERFRKHPDEAEAMGRAARERVRAEHCLAHRAGRILALVLDGPERARKGAEAGAAFGLAVAWMWEAGRLSLPVDAVLKMLDRLPDTPEVLSARIRILAGEGREDELLPRLVGLAAAEEPTEPGLSAACSLSALHVGRFDLAKSFWYRRATEGRSRLPEKPGSPVELYRFWARVLWRSGLRLRQGVPFDETRRVPTTALECLLKALHLDPSDMETHRRLDAAMANVPGAEPSRLGILSHLALRQPLDWRVHFELGMTNLQAFRLREGVGDLMTARDLADKAKGLKHFRLLLSGRDPSGRIAWALAQEN